MITKKFVQKLRMRVIIPAVTYGISVWGGANRQDDLDSLERLYCRAARVIFNFSKDLPSVEVLTRAKWDTLRTLYKQSILKLTCKIYHNDLPSGTYSEIATLL